jgi:Tfp pilus assembly protein PilP
MTSRRRWLIAALAAALIGGVVLAQAQQEAGGSAKSDEEVLQRIEQENEAVQQGRQFSYDPSGRRDPFEPLIKANKVEPQGKRPRGIAGMLISEIALRGIVRDDDGELVALFNGSDNRGYTLRVGDVVYDGRILDIDALRGTVEFRQRVDDPRRIKPYRDVTKRLYPSNEEELEEDDA